MINLFNKIAGVLRKGAKRRSKSPSISLEQVLSEQGMAFTDWIGGLRKKRSLYADVQDTAVNYLKQNFPEQVHGTLNAAEKIMLHAFQLLGSQEFTPVDKLRKCKKEYKKIDWYWDPVQNLHFPRGVFHKEWDLYAMRPENADIKLPWELARCQHFATLGQAYRLSGDTRFCHEIINEIIDFDEANPVGYGIHWTCTMDVAIRAANWALALALIRACDDISCKSWLKAYQSLYNHGDFIFNNFENKYEVTSNHYLSNVVGLFLVSSVFEALPQGRKWNSFCRESLEKEITVQILGDGADFESSVHYHRLVLELFLGAARQAELLGTPFSKQYYTILEKMCRFHAALLYDNGKMPVIGDADDGRLHILTAYGNWNPQYGRHILGPAKGMFVKEEFGIEFEPQDLWETVWWGLEIDDEHKAGVPQRVSISNFFPEAGLVVYNDHRSYLLITNGIVGTKGFGNHKHNDQLSFELHLNRVPIIVDPGSYVYTSDPDARNTFRSTGYHNTIMVDGHEQNEMNPEWIFRLFEKAKARHLFFEDNDDFIQYGGCHQGYAELSSPVIHKRAFRFCKKDRTLIIVDQLEGESIHDLSWHFHLAPNVKVDEQGESKILLSAGGNVFCMNFDPFLKLQVNDAFCSPSYGVKIPCKTIQLSGSMDLGMNNTWTTLINANKWIDDEMSLDLLNSSYKELLNAIKKYEAVS